MSKLMLIIIKILRRIHIMSEAKKGNIVLELKKSGMDVNATINNIIKHFPDLIVYAETKNESANEKSVEETNKESHKTCDQCNNCYDKEAADNNKCNCSKDKSNDDENGEENKANDFRGCVAFGPVDPQTALLINIAESLAMINNNICNIGEILEGTSPKEITEATELKTCKMRTGVSKKQLAKMLDKQKREIINRIEFKLDYIVYHFPELLNGKCIMPINPNIFNDRGAITLPFIF